MSVYWDSETRNGKIKSTPVIFGNMLHVESLGNSIKLNSGPFYGAPVSAVSTSPLPVYTATATTIVNNVPGAISNYDNVFDNVVLTLNARVLVRTAGVDNGVYTVTSTGSLVLPWVLTRVADVIDVGYAVFVTTGDVYANTSFIKIAGTGNEYAQFSAVQTYTGANVGSGENVFDSVVGTVFQFNRISGSGTVEVSQPGGPGSNLQLNVVPSGITHGDLSGLSTDDHSIYALLTGRSTGQTLIGGTDSGNNLTLASTSHPTKGSVRVIETTNSSTPLTGALVVAGGAGFGGNASIGGNVNLTGNIIMQPNATVDGVDVSVLNSTVQSFVGGTAGLSLNSLTPAIVSQLTNINNTTIAPSTWGYISTINQNLSTISNVTFANLTGTIVTSLQPNIDHNSLSNRNVGDPHNQYTLLSGRNGGQTITGGTVAGNNLTLASTSNATKGSVRVIETTNATSPSTGALIVAGGAGVGTDLHVGGSAYIATNLTVSGQLINGVNLVAFKSNFDSLPSNLYTTTQLTNSILTNAISTLAGVTITNSQWASLRDSNAANGVVVTNGTNKIALAQLPTGTTGTTVALGNHTHDFRRTGTIVANTNVATPFSLPELTEVSGAFRIYIHTNDNGPAAIFDICKSNVVGTIGAVTRTVSQIVNNAELSMTWGANVAPTLFHSSTSLGPNNVTYSYTISN